MPLSEITILKIGKSISKLLLKKFFDDTSEDIGNSLLDLTEPHISSHVEQRRAKRQFEDLGDKVAQKLIPSFEREAENISVEAIVTEVASALENNISAKAVIDCNLDAVRLSEVFKTSHYFPVNHTSQAEKIFYENILDEIARYIVEISAALPGYTREYSAKCLSSLENISREIEKTLHIVQSIQSCRSQQVSLPNNRFELDYRQSVIRNLDYMELYGADISHSSKRHVLSAAYVSLNLEKPGADEIEIALFESVLTSIENSPTRNKRLLIRGEAGSGKSTLLRWASIEAAKNTNLDNQTSIIRSSVSVQTKSTRDSKRKVTPILDAAAQQSSELVSEALTEFQIPQRIGISGKKNQGARRKPTSWTSRIPFLIRLRDCEQSGLPAIEEFPSYVAPGISTPPARWVEGILEDGRGIVFIDGVDEVSKDGRSVLYTDLIDLLGRYPDNLYILTTRPTAVPQGWLKTENFIDARINPLSRIDRIRLIEKWHRSHSARDTSDSSIESEVTELEQKLIYQFDINPHIARIASNPLLCAMICALHRDRSTKLPENLSQICEDLCQALLHRRELDSGLTDKGNFPEIYSRLNYPQKKLMVSSIAHYMITNEISVIEYDTAKSKINNVVRQIPNSDLEDAKLILDHIIERSGLIRETRPGKLDFIHNAFKEYLAASIFVENEDIGLLTSRANDEGWQPVIRFAAATSNPRFSSKLIVSLLKEPDENENHSESFERYQTKRVLALQCKYVAQFVAPELIEQLSEIERELIPPTSMQHAEILAASGDSIIPLLDQKGASARQACASIRTLRLIGSDAAKTFLKSFLDDERTSVVSELAQAIEPMMIKVVRESFIQTGSFSKSIAPQVTSLDELLTSAITINASSINLSGTKITDLSPIADNIHLRQLSLSDSSVKDLTPISKLNNLEWLNLAGTEVIDLTPIRSMRKLRVLLIQNTNINNISALADMHSLVCLNICNSKVMDINNLAELSKLEIVYSENNTLINRTTSDSLSTVITSSYNTYFDFLKDLNVGHSYAAGEVPL